METVFKIEWSNPCLDVAEFFKKLHVSMLRQCTMAFSNVPPFSRGPLLTASVPHFAAL